MKKFLGLILCCAAFASASMIGIDALGEEQIAGGSAAAAGRGFAGGAKTGEAEGLSVINPARMAFDTKVVFNLNFLMDMYAIELHSDSYFTSNISMPSFNLSFPMGDFGAFGVSLWQHYASSIRESVVDTLSHADARIDGVTGVVHLDLPAVYQHIAGGGLEQAVELVHQRRLARAVLAQNRVDLAFVDGEVDPVVGDKIAEFLDDVAHFNDGRIHVHIFFCQIDRPLCLK